jgi:hypothetical protein
MLQVGGGAELQVRLEFRFGGVALTQNYGRPDKDKVSFIIIQQFYRADDNGVTEPNWDDYR